MEDKNPKADNYFEGILQLRDIEDEVIEYATGECKKRSIFMIAKIKAYKNGIDLFMQSNKFLKTLGKKLSSKFNGELTISAKLHTRDKQTSKDLYRITTLFRQCQIKKGDLIIVKGDEYKVVGVTKKVNLRSVNDGKKVSYSFRDISKLRYRKKDD